MAVDRFLEKAAVDWARENSAPDRLAGLNSLRQHPGVYSLRRSFRAGIDWQIQRLKASGVPAEGLKGLRREVTGREAAFIGSIADFDTCDGDSWIMAVVNAFIAGAMALLMEAGLGPESFTLEKANFKLTFSTSLGVDALGLTDKQLNELSDLVVATFKEVLDRVRDKKLHLRDVLQVEVKAGRHPLVIQVDTRDWNVFVALPEERE